MKNKFKNIARMLLMAVLICSFIVPSEAYAANYVPNLSHAGYNKAASPFIQTRESLRGQCTWFAWGRTYEKLGIKLNSNFYGNAKTWWTKNISSKSYSYGQEPKSNSIAVFGNGEYGHVVFVENVSNGKIYFNEANHHKRGAYDGAVEVETISAFKSRSSNFLGFIYVGGNQSLSDSNPTQINSSDNAKIVKDWAYVRDSNGNIITGKRVDIGDSIKVKEINYDKQLAYVEYSTSNGRSSGWITNCSIISYYYQGQYKNGSTPEPVYDAAGKKIGSLNAYETATPLFRNPSNNMLYVVYNTSKGTNTKAGYVKYNGGFTKF